jgi:hypothetical protein
MKRAVKVRTLDEGDVVIFGMNTRRTVVSCEPSAVDPVYLIRFEEEDGLLAKGPDEDVLIEV